MAASVAVAVPSPIVSVERLSEQKDLYDDIKLLPHTAITQDFDRLKFDAAAFHQVQHCHAKDSFAPAISSSLLISSPYNSKGHLLDLTDLGVSNRLFAVALTALRPIRSDYATADYVDSFNWESVMSILREFSTRARHTWSTQSFYVVIFRSKLRESADRELLHQLDEHSHVEAVEGGGLLKYWFGTCDDDFRNLATCIWRSREDAKKGGAGPWHRRARGAARDLYADISITTHRLTIHEGARSWSIESWTETRSEQERT